MKKSIGVGFVLALCIMLFPYTSVYPQDTNLLEEQRILLSSDYVVHEPILISSDSDFESQDWPGNGTLEDPYVIENLTITQQVKYDPCIEIEYTTVYYAIRNCYLEAPLDGNTMYIRSAPNGRFEDCVFVGSGGYISAAYCVDSFYLVMSNCTVIGEADFNDCDWSEVRDCTIYDELSVFSSPNCLVDNCEIFSTHWGAADISGNNNRFYNCNITTTANGWGLRLRGYGYGFHVANVSVTGVTRYGIDVTSVSDSIIENCEITNLATSAVGIALEYSIERNIIRNNTIIGTGVGIHVEDASDCEIYYNKVIGNSGVGILLDSSSSLCTVVNNSIGGNGINAQDEGGGSTWDDGIQFGNLYSDYEGGESYEINGSANSIDHYPRKLELTPPIIRDVEDFEYEINSTDNRIIWHVIDFHPDNYSIFQNNILIHFENDWNGSDIILSVDGLSIGAHNYTLVVYDAHGGMDTDTVIVSVYEIIPTTTTSTTTYPSTNSTSTTTYPTTNSTSTITHTNTTTSTTTGLPIDVQLGMFFIGSVGSAIIIITFIVILRRGKV